MKIKKYKNEIKITTIIGIILNVFIYFIGIILLSKGKAFETAMFILIVATTILGMIIYEKKIIKKYKLKSSSYNVLVVLNILLYGLICTIITSAMQSKGLIFPCEDIVCMLDGIEVLIIYFSIIYFIIGYTLIKSFIYAKNSKIKKYKYYFKLLLVILYTFISIYIISLTL